MWTVSRRCGRTRSSGSGAPGIFTTWTGWNATCYEHSAIPATVPRQFVPEAGTRAAARAGIVPPGSEAEQVVRTVVENFVREEPAPDH